MGKPYSEDLRKRVVAAVESDGLSCNRAAKRFGIAISTAIGWVRRLRETGSVAPGKMGGHRPKAISGEHRVWLLQRIKRDFTLRGLVAEGAHRRCRQPARADRDPIAPRHRRRRRIRQKEQPPARRSVTSHPTAANG
jgi:transposase